MSPSTAVEAIFLDLGNTFRTLIKDEVHMDQARRKIVELLGSDEDPLNFCAKLDERYKSYREWAFENLAEAPEVELWTRWLVPEFPAGKVSPLAEELTFQFRQSFGRRVVVPGGREVVAELCRRGYILGIISNLIGTREIPEWLQSDGFTPFFKSVVLSSIFGRRKPDPSIYLEAARLAGVDPACCVYIGDNPKRDIVGTRQAGFGMVVILMDARGKEKQSAAAENEPDVVIHDFCELLNTFPERNNPA
jgi:putative hydrolase of the HAD superfamily